MLPSQLSFGELTHPGSANWEHGYIELAEQTTATSSMPRPLAGKQSLLCMLSCTCKATCMYTTHKDTN